MTEVLTGADDAFHTPTDDPWWTETMWFSWNVPERELLGYVYPVFRPNAGVQFGGVVVFGAKSTPPWEEPVYDFEWHQPIPAGLDLRAMTLASGLSIRAVEPGSVYSIAYSTRDLTLDLHVHTQGPALVTRRFTPPLGAGHIDQMCRVAGHMVYEGQTIPVNCLAIRDRAWGPRRDGRQPRVFYCWGAASPENFFLAAGAHHDEVDTIHTGFMMRDGTWSPVTGGQRRVLRDSAGQVASVHITAVDANQHLLEATGQAKSRHLFEGYPGMICWTGLVEWTFDGHQGWGEDQDVWSRRAWRDHRSTPS